MNFIHICIILFATHANESLNQKVGGIANQVLQLLPAYEKIEDLKVSVFSKYSKYKPNTERIKVYNIQKFSNIQKFALRTVNTLYFYDLDGNPGEQIRLTSASYDIKKARFEDLISESINYELSHSQTSVRL